MMKLPKLLFLLSAVFLLLTSASVASASDFEWMRDFNLRAEADPSGFRAQLATRFRLGDAQVTAVIGNVAGPADAYMVFRLGEMAGRPPEYVLEQYKTGRGKGWGALAQSLGIKPGSPEFHALKRGHDLYLSDDRGRNRGDKGKARK